MKPEEIPLPNLDCPLCCHPQRVSGASMRELGASDSEVATALQLDEACVSRHFTSCVKTIPLNPEEIGTVEGSDQQLQVLLQNATELYHSSVLTGNYVSASSSLAVRLRCLAEIGRRAETRAKNRGEILTADVEDCSTWDPDLRDWVFRYQNSILDRMRNMKEEKA